MDHHLTVCGVVVVEPRLILTQYKIGLEADHVVEEATELVDLGADNDVRARVLCQVFLVTLHLLLQTLACVSQSTNLVAKLKHGKELALTG